MNEDFSAYESWDLQPPAWPPRSRLFPLVPQGSGTGLGESFTSYLARLAAAHCLTVTTCYSFLLYPAMQHLAESSTAEGTKSASRKSTPGITYSSHTWNGVSAIAALHVNVTEQLTGARDLRLLTWLPWAALLTHHLRRQRAWCPQCFAAWRAAGQTLYEPLLWTLHAVQYCPHHQCALLTNCPTCQRSSAILGRWAQAGYCFRCRHWLGATTESSPATTNATTNATMNPAVTEAVLIAQSLSTMIAQAGTLTAAPTRALVTQNLRTLFQHLGGNCQAIARVLGFYHTAVVNWREGYYVPRLTTLAKFCLRLSLPLVDFLTRPLSPELDPRTLRAAFFPQPTAHATTHTESSSSVVTASPTPALPASSPYLLQPMTDEQMRRRLENELAQPQPRSLTTLAQEIGYLSLNPLYLRFPDILQALVTKRRSRKKAGDSTWRKRGKRILTAALAETPLPIMPVLATRVGRVKPEELCSYFPAECCALREQRTQRAQAQQQERAAKLQAALQEDPPRPLRHVVASLNLSLWVAYHQHHELACAISARAATHRQTQLQQAKRALQERLHQLAAELRAQGLPPTEENLSALAPDLNRATLRRVGREIAAEESTT